MWGYGVDPVWGSNATSGRDSWFGRNPAPHLGDQASASLATTAGILVPAGQQTYLRFNQWRVFEWFPPGSVQSAAAYIDGGTVDVDAGSGPVDAATLPWTNGPQQTLQAYPGFTSPWAGRTAFAGDSFGWTTSQLDLSSFAGQIVTPSFTTRGDEAFGTVGWFLDDITVYTCDPAPVPPADTPTETPTTAPSTPPTTPAPPPAVSKAPSTTRVKARTRTTVKLIARVRSAGATVPGKVVFRVGRRKVVKTVRLANGRAVLTLTSTQVRKLGPGAHRVRAVYQGSDTVERSRAVVSFRLR